MTIYKNSRQFPLRFMYKNQDTLRHAIFHKKLNLAFIYKKYDTLSYQVYAMFYRNDGPDSPPLWGRDLGFVRVDVQEAGGGTRRFLKTNNGVEGGATGGQDL